jgi:hypothetical protein
MPLLIPFVLGAFVIHAFHTSVNHAAHVQRMQERHDEHEARLRALEEKK